MSDYIKWIREKVGHEQIILNFAGGCIRNQNGDILLQRRVDKDSWGLPGGAVELGESVEQTAIREILEETGLEVRPIRQIGVYSDYYDTYPNGDQAQTIAVFFECEVVGGELITDSPETLELKYFSADELPPLVNRQHEDVIADFLQGKIGVFR